METSLVTGSTIYDLSGSQSRDSGHQSSGPPSLNSIPAINSYCIRIQLNYCVKCPKCQKSNLIQFQLPAISEQSTNPTTIKAAVLKSFNYAAQVFRPDRQMGGLNIEDMELYPQRVKLDDLAYLHDGEKLTLKQEAHPIILTCNGEACQSTNPRVPDSTGRLTILTLEDIEPSISDVPDSVTIPGNGFDAPTPKFIPNCQAPTPLPWDASPTSPTDNLPPKLPKRPLHLIRQVSTTSDASSTRDLISKTDDLSELAFPNNMKNVGRIVTEERKRELSKRVTSKRCIRRSYALMKTAPELEDSAPFIIVYCQELYETAPKFRVINVSKDSRYFLHRNQNFATVQELLVYYSTHESKSRNEKFGVKFKYLIQPSSNYALSVSTDRSSNNLHPIYLYGLQL